MTSEIPARPPVEIARGDLIAWLAAPELALWPAHITVDHLMRAAAQALTDDDTDAGKRALNDLAQTLDIGTAGDARLTMGAASVRNFAAAWGSR